jgi:non-specific serine/threonine protein kinase/serine/threonine-protein kinase
MTLGELLLETRRYVDAANVFEEAVTRLREKHGGDHVELARALNNLGLAHRRQGDHTKAESLTRESLAMNRRLGEENLDLAMNLVNLSTILALKKDHAGAVPLLREGLALRLRLLGEEHEDVLLARHELGKALLGAGAPDEAEEVFRASLCGARKLWGEDHPFVAHLIADVAMAQRDAGRLEEAEGTAREALARARQIHGRAHPATMSALRILADILRQRHDWAALGRVQREAFPLETSKLDKTRPPYLMILCQHACALLFAGDPDAEPLLRHGLSAMRSALGDRHPGLALPLRMLAYSRLAEGAHEEAEKLLREVLEIHRATGTDGSAALAALAQVRIEKGDTDAAEPVLRDLLARHRAGTPPRYPLDGVLSLFGACLLRKGEYANAEPLLRECVAIRRKATPVRWNLPYAMSLLGESLHAQGKHAEAEPLLLEGYGLMRPPAFLARYRRQALERIVALYETWGKPDKAAEWRAKR